eukprot:scaffold36199_cov55-Attheya_sp.AAC.1
MVVVPLLVWFRLPPLCLSSRLAYSINRIAGWKKIEKCNEATIQLLKCFHIILRDSTSNTAGGCNFAVSSAFVPVLYLSETMYFPPTFPTENITGGNRRIIVFGEAMFGKER